MTVSNGIGVGVKVSVGISVGAEVKTGVDVRINVEVGLEVIIGPKNCPCPRPEINRLTKITANKGHIRVF